MCWQARIALWETQETSPAHWGDMENWCDVQKRDGASRKRSHSSQCAGKQELHFGKHKKRLRRIGAIWKIGAMFRNVTGRHENGRTVPNVLASKNCIASRLFRKASSRNF